MLKMTGLISKSTLIGAALGSLFVVESASAQQMGKNGYSFPVRNPSLAAQFQFQRMNGGAVAGSSAAGLGVLNQFVTTYSSNSTSIGNMNTVNQNLSEGSQGTVGQTTDQQSTGNQGSKADTQATVDNSIVSTDAAAEAASGQSSVSDATSDPAEATTTTSTKTTKTAE